MPKPMATGRELLASLYRHLAMTKGEGRSHLLGRPFAARSAALRLRIPAAAFCRIEPFQAGDRPGDQHQDARNHGNAEDEEPEHFDQAGNEDQHHQEHDGDEAEDDDPSLPFQPDLGDPYALLGAPQAVLQVADLIPKSRRHVALPLPFPIRRTERSSTTWGPYEKRVAQWVITAFAG